MELNRLAQHIWELYGSINVLTSCQRLDISSAPKRELQNVAPGVLTTVLPLKDGDVRDKGTLEHNWESLLGVISVPGC
jgi:hypothetical protein